MARRIALSVVAVAMAVLVGGCASKSDFTKLAKRVDTIQAEQETQSSEMTKLSNSLRTVESSTQEKVADVDASLKKLEADMAKVSEDMARLAEDHKKLETSFGGVTKSVTEAQKMLLSTLKNARDIYGAQFRALNEVLETLESAETKAPVGN